MSVCVSPVCEADAVVNDAATVPEPSAASFFSAKRCATQSELVTHVAVLLPEAPAAACTPSANPDVTFVAAGGRDGPLADEPLRAGLRDGHAVRDAVGGLQHLVRGRGRDREPGRVAGRRGAAARHRERQRATALVEADERVDALVGDDAARRVGVAAGPRERERATTRVPSTRCQKTACSIGAVASCAVVPIWLQPAGGVIAPVERTVSCATSTSPAPPPTAS